MSLAQIIDKSTGQVVASVVPDVSVTYGYATTVDKSTVGTPDLNIQATSGVKISAGPTAGLADTSFEVKSQELNIAGLNLPVVAGSATGDYLPIRINGTVYHIALLANS